MQDVGANRKSRLCQCSYKQRRKIAVTCEYVQLCYCASQLCCGLLELGCCGASSFECFAKCKCLPHQPVLMGASKDPVNLELGLQCPETAAEKNPQASTNLPLAAELKDCNAPVPDLSAFNLLGLMSRIPHLSCTSLSPQKCL